MIIGGVLILIALGVYIFNKKKLPNKGSLSYYRYKWKMISTNYNK